MASRTWLLPALETTLISMLAGLNLAIPPLWIVAQNRVSTEQSGVTKW